MQEVGTEEETGGVVCLCLLKSVTFTQSTEATFYNCLINTTSAILLQTRHQQDGLFDFY